MDNPIITARESQIREAHEHYRRDEESQIRDGFRAVEDLLQIVDAQRQALAQAGTALAPFAALAECGDPSKALEDAEELSFLDFNRARLALEAVRELRKGGSSA